MKKRGAANINEFVAEKVIQHMEYRDFEVKRLKLALTRVLRKSNPNCLVCDRVMLDHVTFYLCDICADPVSCSHMGCEDRREECHKCNKKCCADCLHACLKREEDGIYCNNDTCIMCCDGLYCFGCQLASSERRFPCGKHVEKLESYTDKHGHVIPLSCFECREAWTEMEAENPDIFKTPDSFEERRTYYDTVERLRVTVHFLNNHL